MLSYKEKTQKNITIDGMVMKPDWGATFKSMKVGEEKTFKRPLLTTSRARGIATRINSNSSMRFSVATGELDEYCTVKREK